MIAMVTSGSKTSDIMFPAGSYERGKGQEEGTRSMPAKRQIGDIFI